LTFAILLGLGNYYLQRKTGFPRLSETKNLSLLNVCRKKSTIKNNSVNLFPLLKIKIKKQFAQTYHFKRKLSKLLFTFRPSFDKLENLLGCRLLLCK